MRINNYSVPDQMDHQLKIAPGSNWRHVVRLGFTMATLMLSACSAIFGPPATPTPAFTPTPRWTTTPVPTPTATFTPTPSPTPTATPLPTPMALAVSVKMDGVLNLLAEPKAKAAVVGSLPPGVIVPIVDMTDDGIWLKVGNEPSGWVLATTVSLNGEVLVSGDVTTERQPLVQSDSAVNVRSGPGSRNKVIGLLKAGQIARVIDQDAKGTWLQITFDDVTGWIAAQTVIVTGLQATPVPEPTPTDTH